MAKSGWGIIKHNPISATDSYGFAILIFEAFNGSVIEKDQIGQTKGIPPTMHQGYKRLLNANAKARLSVSHFRDQGRRNGGFFETPLIKFSEAIESLGLKSEGESAPGAFEIGGVRRRGTQSLCLYHEDRSQVIGRGIRLDDYASHRTAILQSRSRHPSLFTQ